MISSQVLIKDGSTAALTPDRLTLTRDSGRVRVEIPLAVVQRADPSGETGIRVHLTDEAVHSIPGGNATATAAFLAALNAALPEERDPAGSALVTTEVNEGTRPWVRWSAGGAVLLAYLGYVTWVGVTYNGGASFLTVVATLVALLGLACVVGVVSKALDRVTLARRGITVIGIRGHHPNGVPKKYFAFTDTSGNEHLSDSTRSGQTAHIVYDPERPGTNVARQPLAWVLVKYTLSLIIAIGILGLGALGIAVPYL
ncbi:hypothetical protein AB0B30_23685 [Streptomyces narbonensis]|uniref:DUF3592 domain-containing protein n=1 Tax=Streptomyces narbonensis TaxID=67333 RepID=A0ABV3CHD8_9ACTN